MIIELETNTNLAPANHFCRKSYICVFIFSYVIEDN